MNFLKIFILIVILSLVSLFLLANKKSMLSSFLSIKMSAIKFNDGPNYLNYRLYKPKNKTEELYPLVIYLHGGGQGGDDNLKQLDKVVYFFTQAGLQKKYPSFVIAPQCPLGKQWVNTKFKARPFDHYDQSKIAESPEFIMLTKVIGILFQKYPIDKNRIYITGFSMGSSGTWDFISRHPHLFAAAIPMSGVSDTSTVNKIIDIPIWAFHGENDDIAPVRLNVDMQRLINKAGGNCKLTIFKGVGHGCVKQALDYPGLEDWLFMQKRN